MYKSKEYPSSYHKEAERVCNVIYNFERLSLEREACQYIVKELFILKYKEIDVIVIIFETLILENLSSWTLIALIRCTFYYKELIPNWTNLRDYTEEYFQSIGLDSNKELHGLF